MSHVWHTAHADLQISVYILYCLAPSAGDLINYERQEFIGDSLLKLFVTLHVFTQSSLRSEGDLTRVRSKFVSNDTLHWIAVRKAMVHMMRVQQLQVRETYFPPGFHFNTGALSGKCSRTSFIRTPRDRQNLLPLSEIHVNRCHL